MPWPEGKAGIFWFSFVISPKCSAPPFCRILSLMGSFSLPDKDSKMRYLEKALDCVAFASGMNLTAKPGKIVSGQVSPRPFELQLSSLLP